MTIPDRDIKKVKIDHSDLLAISQNNKYYLRYRIVYEDGSQQSAWSPKYSIDGKSIQRVTYGEEISKPTIKSDDVYITCDWNIPVSLKNRKFDVMVRWSYEEPIAITNATSSLGITTYTVGNSYSDQDLITVSNISPSDYNTDLASIISATPTSISIAKDIDIAYSSGGIVRKVTEWFYDSTVSSGTANIVIPSQSGIKAKYVQVLVQLETVPKAVSENNSSVLFETDITTTKNILDGGTP